MVSYIRVRLGILATVFGFIVITIVYFLSVFFILMWRRYQFEKLINSIVIEYQETKNGKLLKKLLTIDVMSKDMSGEIVWYFNGAIL